MKQSLLPARSVRYQYTHEAFRGGGGEGGGGGADERSQGRQQTSHRDWAGQGVGVAAAAVKLPGSTQDGACTAATDGQP